MAIKERSRDKLPLRRIPASRLLCDEANAVADHAKSRPDNGKVDPFGQAFRIEVVLRKQVADNPVDQGGEPHGWIAVNLYIKSDRSLGRIVSARQPAGAIARTSTASTAASTLGNLWENANLNPADIMVKVFA
ncbi:hypothetical protein GCM10023156_39740 [Novipirellula rosea]|uniref:Uncharacterized protein n=1 Tax=Novipirellula rosea TaxID=1031540 RepID=A0ABP8N5A5_9BACT